jgi:hypothetical protein
MGSGSKRKLSSDKPIIRTPKGDSSSGNGSGGGVKKSASDEAANVCIPSFESIIEKSNITKVDAIVNLKKKENLYTITLFGEEIGILSKKLSEMIDTCTGLGIKYDGRIVQHKRDEKLYARFSRTAF